jgi:hypothetical protein
MLITGVVGFMVESIILNEVLECSNVDAYNKSLLDADDLLVVSHQYDGARPFCDGEYLYS